MCFLIDLCCLVSGKICGILSYSISGVLHAFRYSIRRSSVRLNWIRGMLTLCIWTLYCLLTHRGNDSSSQFTMFSLARYHRVHSFEPCISTYSNDVTFQLVPFISVIIECTRFIATQFHLRSDGWPRCGLWQHGLYAFHQTLFRKQWDDIYQFICIHSNLLSIANREYRRKNIPKHSSRSPIRLHGCQSQIQYVQ